MYAIPSNDERKPPALRPPAHLVAGLEGHGPLEGRPKQPALVVRRPAHHQHCGTVGDCLSDVVSEKIESQIQLAFLISDFAFADTTDDVFRLLDFALKMHPFLKSAIRN